MSAGGCRAPRRAFKRGDDGQIARDENNRPIFECARCKRPVYQSSDTGRWRHGDAASATATPTGPTRLPDWATDIDRAAPITWEGSYGRGVWESWQGYVDYATQPVPPGLVESANRRIGENSWAGGTWDDAVNLARNGFHDSIMEVDRFAKAVAYQVIGERLAHDWDFARDVTGDTIDVGAYLSGEPESMVYPLPAETVRAGQVVRLLVSADFNGNVDTETVRQRGAAIVALVDVLARAGFTLEIWAHWSYCRGHRLSNAVRVQSATDPVDMGIVTYALAHPTALRRIGFASADRVPNKAWRDALSIGTGYGTAGEPEPRDFPEFDGPSVTIRTLRSSDDWSESGARAWINATLDVLESESE